LCIPCAQKLLNDQRKLVIIWFSYIFFTLLTAKNVDNVQEIQNDINDECSWLLAVEYWS